MIPEQFSVINGECGTCEENMIAQSWLGDANQNVEGNFSFCKTNWKEFPLRDMSLFILHMPSAGANVNCFSGL